MDYVFLVIYYSDGIDRLLESGKQLLIYSEAGVTECPSIIKGKTKIRF